MKVEVFKYCTEIHGVDRYGKFLIRIQKDCSQMQIETEDNGDSYVDINFRELKIIRDAITDVLNKFENEDH